MTREYHEGYQQGYKDAKEEGEEQTTKNDLGVDCVARQDVERYIEGFINEYTPKEELEFINLELDGLKHLPSVTPQEPKTGHWIDDTRLGYHVSICSNCEWKGHGAKNLMYRPKYCPKCGARMAESEGKE